MDVIVRVKKFIFLSDFMIMHMEEKSPMQVILGRLFLEPSGALIDVLIGKITLRVREEKMKIYALSCTNLGPHYPIAKNPTAPPHFNIIFLKSST